MTYTDPQTKEYWLRVFAALKFVEGIPTAALEGRTLDDIVGQLQETTYCLIDVLGGALDRITADEVLNDSETLLSHFRPAPSDNQEEQSDG